MTTLDFRLPRHLVKRALVEHAAHGMILSDTAALLMEAGADMHRLEKQVFEQTNMENA